jgi:hypothetical protein
MSTPKFVFLMESQQLPPATGIEWADWANVAAAIIVAYAALSGLNTWRREHRAKRTMEVAEQVLATSYECLDAIDTIRHGWMPAQEVEQVARLAGESDDDYRHRRYFEVTYLRYSEHAEKFGKLMAQRFRVEVLFGTEHRQAMEQVQRLVNRVKDAAQAAFTASDRHRRLPDSVRQQAKADELWAAFEHHDSVMMTLKPKEEDPFYAELAAARIDLERLFKRAAADGSLPKKVKKVP